MEKKKTLALGGILLLGIGFAAVSTTLYINGTVNIKADTQDFEENVIFNSVAVDSVSETAGTTANIIEDGKKIEITTHNLKSIGEQVTVEYDIKNDSQYNAEIGELTCTSTDADWATYISLTEANDLNGTTVAKTETSGKDNIVIEMVRSYVGTADSNEKEFTFTCSMNVSATES